MRLDLKSIPNFIKNLASFVVSATFLFLVAPLQADPHHDGVILAPAIAFSEGLPVHSGAFSQYGPLSPILSGLFLRFTENNLISLRYFAAIQAIIICILLFLILKEVTSQTKARAFTLLWVLASGIWSTRFPGALMAWPSLLSTMILTLSLLLAIKVVKETVAKPTLVIALVGFLIAVSGFARSQSWAIAAAPGVVFLVSSSEKIRKIFFLILGYITGFAVLMLILWRSNSIESWWLQSIYWPTQFYPGFGKGNNYNRFQMLLYLIEAILLIAFAFLNKAINSKFGKNIAIIFFSSTIILCLMIGWWIPTLSEVPIRFRVLFGEPFERILVSPIYLATLIVIGMALKTIFSYRKNKAGLELLIYLYGAIATIQLFPQADIMHLWWIAPLLLPGLCLAVEEIAVKNPKFSQSLYQIIVGISIAGSVLAINFIGGDWKEYQNVAFKGTYASTEKVTSLRLYNKIEDLAVIRNSSFDCPDGVYSVIGGKYLPADEWYVNWGFLENDKPSLGKVRFICGRSLQYAKSEADKLGWEVSGYTALMEAPEISLAILQPSDND